MDYACSYPYPIHTSEMIYNVAITLYCIHTGLFSVRYPELMLEPEAKQLYFDWLSEECEPVKKIEVS